MPRRSEGINRQQKGVKMGIFSRKQRGLLPPDTLQMMERFGRHEIDVMSSSDDAYAVFQATQEPLFPVASDQPDLFIKELADVCVPIGGWVVYGAGRTVVNLVGIRPANPDWTRIVDATISFLRSNLVPPIRVRPYEWERFVQNGGTANTWLELRVPPTRDQSKISPLQIGEQRSVIRLSSDPNANMVIVERRAEGYVALIDAAWSDDDPTRSQKDWKSAESLYDIYSEVAWSSQVWDWVDSEIEPFMPTAKALI
jgi:hypothetical protein